MRILAVDGGNSHLRFAIVDTDKKSVSKRVYASFKDFKNLLIQSFNDEKFYCSVSTVVESAKKEILAINSSIPNIIDTLFLDAKDSPINIEYNKLTIGIDRVVDAIGAKALYENRNLIIVDSGTATTVDLLLSDGTLKGGVILPGLKLKAESLWEKTDKLPKIDPYKLSLTDTPKTTSDALITGLILDTVGGIEKAIEHMAKNIANFEVIGCGGGWEIIEKYLPSSYITEPKLTLLGTGLMGEFILKSRKQ